MINLDQFLDSCIQTTPFNALSTIIEGPSDPDVVIRLPDQVFSLLEELATKIATSVEGSFNAARNKTVHAYKLTHNSEIPLHVTEDKGAVAGNHASGNARKFIAVVILSSDVVLCRQSDSKEGTIRECYLHPGDAITIYPNTIHAFGLPEKTKLLILSDMLWEKASEDSSRELISWDFYKSRV